MNAIVGGAGGPLAWNDRRIPMSLSTHLADIYPEELDKVLALPEVSSQVSSGSSSGSGSASGPHTSLTKYMKIVLFFWLLLTCPNSLLAHLSFSYNP